MGNVVFTLFLLYRDVVHRLTVLRAYVQMSFQSDCPKILILSFRDTNAQTTKRHDNKTTRQQNDSDDRNNERNDNDEGLAALDDNTNNAVEARPIKSLQGVVRS